MTSHMDTYIAWVNNQLKKRPEVAQLPIKDLQDRRMRDGTCLALLIEIVAGERIASLNRAPTSDEARQDNIARILQFMRQKRIKMHAIDPMAVVTGDIKSIMRIVLALAAHFKPSSVRQSAATAAVQSRSATSSSPKSLVPPHPHLQRQQLQSSNLASVAHDVAISLHRAKKQVQRSPSLLAKRSFNCEATSSALSLLDCTSAQASPPLLDNSSSSNRSSRTHSIDDAGDSCSKDSSFSLDATFLTAATADAAEVRQLLEQLQSLLQSLECDQSATDALLMAADRRLEAEVEAEKVRTALLESREETRQAVKAATYAEERVAHLQHQLLEAEAAQSSRLATLENGQEREQVILDCLQRLRSNLSSGDAQHFTLDTLEHCLGLNSVLEGGSSNCRSRQSDQRGPINVDQSQMNGNGGTTVDSDYTNLVYFTEQTLAPIMLTITKKARDLRLSDVRRATQHTRPYYRFIFKTYDPDFGLIKKELMREDESVPLWKGKVVMWIFNTALSTGSNEMRL